MSKWKVYISSTFRDLKDYRGELITLFQNQLKNNFELCEIMERMFDDGTYTPYADDCVEAVLESDIYIIILGNKIGSFPPNDDRTYTEIELDTAIANDKRVFCLRLEHFIEADIDNKIKHDELLTKFKGRPIHTFNDPISLKNALYEFLIPFSSQTPVNQKNPYKGLASFNVNDGNYFFGRDAELEGCLKKIITASGNYFVSVIGDSGTGKSSFAKAGLMFRLNNKEEYGFSERKQIIVTPANEPFTNLKYQLQLQGISVEEILNPNSESPDLILFFDQFEEVITQCHTSEALKERRELFKFLDALASDKNINSKVLVICAFRSDFLSQLANFDFIKSHQYLFPLSSFDYKVHSNNWEKNIAEIISKPALKNGVVIEKELIEQILEQMKEVDGALPILQFTLDRIWNKESIEDRRISSTEFNNISKGKGISGIIETHAENVIKSITNEVEDKEKESILQSIFVNLVEVNENLKDVKKTVSKNELFSILKHHPEKLVHEVFEALVSERSRLLNISKDNNELINVGIIHEELIRKWERLKSWINERRDALELKKKINLDMVAFEKNEASLYQGKELKFAIRWSKNNPDLINNDIHLFINKSIKKRKTNLAKRIVLIPVIAIILLFFTYFMRLQLEKSDRVKEVADRSRMQAEQSEKQALVSRKSAEEALYETRNSLLETKNLEFYKLIKKVLPPDSSLVNITKKMKISHKNLESIDFYYLKLKTKDSEVWMDTIPVFETNWIDKLDSINNTRNNQKIKEWLQKEFDLKGSEFNVKVN